MKVTNNPVDLARTVEKSNQPGRANRRTEGEASASAVGSSSSVNISENARLMQDALEVAKTAPGAKANQIAELRQAIADGSYQIDSQDIADRVLQEHLESDFGKNRL